MMPKSRYSLHYPEQPSPARSDAVFVRYLDPNTVRDPKIADQLVQWLNAQERQRLEKFSRPSLGHVYLAAHALKRGFLGRVLGYPPQDLQFEIGSKGKPSISEPAGGEGWHFNLSHTETMVALAVSRQPVGIDVEDTTRGAPDIALAKRYFSASEYERIAASPAGEQSRLFFHYWTLKEAFLKAEGWGLSQRLNVAEFDLSGPIQLSVLDPLAQPTQAWRFWQTQPTPSHLVSVALVTTATNIESAIDCRAWQITDWGITRPDHGE